MSALEPGAIAPDFKLIDLDGKRHSLAEIGRDDLLLLAFYHGECPTCQFAMPAIGAMARKAKSPRVKVWGVSEDPEDESAAFAAEMDLRMPILIDAEPYRVSAAYGLSNVPTLFLIDGKHRIVKQCAGFSKADFLAIAATLVKEAHGRAPDIFRGYREVPAMRPG